MDRPVETMILLLICLLPSYKVVLRSFPLNWVYECHHMGLIDQVRTDIFRERSGRDILTDLVSCNPFLLSEYQQRSQIRHMRHSWAFALSIVIISPWYKIGFIGSSALISWPYKSQLVGWVKLAEVWVKVRHEFKGFMSGWLLTKYRVWSRRIREIRNKVTQRAGFAVQDLRHRALLRAIT